MSSSSSPSSGRSIKVEAGRGGLSFKVPINGSKSSTVGRELFKTIATVLRSQGIGFEGNIHGISLGDIVYGEDTVFNLADIKGVYYRIRRRLEFQDSLSFFVG